MKKAIISLSGGLDSTCLLMYLLSKGYRVKAYSFYYGQKHAIELKKVKKNIKFLERKGLLVEWRQIDLSDCFDESASSLHIGGEEIPEGHYAEENMKSTVVENRNMIFAAILYGKALSWAKREGEHVEIHLGIHNGDHCFTEDTQVLTVDGYKTVHELKIGDKVYSFNGVNTEIDSVVDIIEKGTNSTIYNIKTTSGYIRLTGKHKVYCIEKENFTSKLTEEIKEGDILLSLHDPFRKSNIVEDKVLSIEVEKKREKVYDLSIEKNHNFFAGEYGNILISNSIYPDTTVESREACEHAFRTSNWGSDMVSYEAPFIDIDKSQVLSKGINAMWNLNFRASEIKKVLSNTHTCYNPDSEGRSCGKCGSCTERLEAFEKNNMKDPVEYQNHE